MAEQSVFDAVTLASDANKPLDEIVFLNGVRCSRQLAEMLSTDLATTLQRQSGAISHSIDDVAHQAHVATEKAEKALFELMDDLDDNWQNGIDWMDNFVADWNENIRSVNDTLVYARECIVPTRNALVATQVLCAVAVAWLVHYSWRRLTRTTTCTPAKHHLAPAKSENATEF